MSQRSTASPRPPRLLLLLSAPVLVATLLLGAPDALAQSAILSSGPEDRRQPNADGTALEEFTAPRVGYSFWVDQRGLYTIESERVQEPFPGRVLLHRGPIDLDHPLDRLIAVVDYDEAGEGVSFDVLLEAGVIYYVSVTYSEPTDGIHDVIYRATDGPSEVRLSVCIPPDDHFETIDLGEALALAEDFCVEVEWRDHQGNTGIGTSVPYRSADSGMFWFFDRDNWEILVKVLDGCGVNGHYWVFFAAATDVEFDLYVTPRDGDYQSGPVYSNALGHTADAVTDTAAFPCEKGQGGT